MNPQNNNKQKQDKPEPREQQNQQGNQQKKLPANYRRGPFTWLIIALMILLVMMTIQHFQARDKINWTEFKTHLRSGHIQSVVIKDREITGEFNESGIRSLKEGRKKAFVTYYTPGVQDEGLGELLAESKVEVESEPPRTWLIGLLQMIFPILVLVGFFYFMFARNLRQGAGGMLMSFGRSRHRLQEKDKTKVTFKDVAGIEEAKDEVAEIIEFLRNPKKFQRLGGRIPRGVLLVGPPGCGKTLLAKAIAGEADVPFLSISGSDFVEMFVGVGASRVRDLFKQAKDSSPCIIFLDEIDAIGRKRGAGVASGGHDEREQTLNAILVEMDGFETNDQVIVIAATNRGDILDQALTRPGRFDRQIYVPLPDLHGRADILRIHAKGVKFGPDADMDRLARGTAMFTGADLAAIINEAAIAATMENKDCVEMTDLEEARDKVRWGRARRSKVIDKKERRVTAYHEAGHTIVQSLLADADPLHKVSIIPRGPMGGATFALPEKDRTMFSRKYCMALLEVCFGGRIAEEIFCDDISSGAQSDIQQATRLARQMVLSWGMSKQLGPINYSPDSGSDQNDYLFPGAKDYSEKTAEEIDQEVRRITSEAYEKAEKLINTHKGKLDKIAEALLKYETLDADDVKLILEGGNLDKPTVGDLIKAEKDKDSHENKKKVEHSDKKKEEAKTRSDSSRE